MVARLMIRVFRRENQNIFFYYLYFLIKQSRKKKFCFIQIVTPLLWFFTKNTHTHAHITNNKEKNLQESLNLCWSTTIHCCYYYCYFEQRQVQWNCLGFEFLSVWLDLLDILKKCCSGKDKLQLMCTRSNAKMTQLSISDLWLFSWFSFSTCLNNYQTKINMVLNRKPTKINQQPIHRVKWATYANTNQTEKH